MGIAETAVKRARKATDMKRRMSGSDSQAAAVRILASIGVSSKWGGGRRRLYSGLRPWAMCLDERTTFLKKERSSMKKKRKTQRADKCRRNREGGCPAGRPRLA